MATNTKQNSGELSDEERKQFDQLAANETNRDFEDIASHYHDNEARQESQIPSGHEADLRNPQNIKREDPWLYKQNQLQDSNRAAREKEAERIPNKDLRENENDPKTKSALEKARKAFGTTREGLRDFLENAGLDEEGLAQLLEEQAGMEKADAKLVSKAVMFKKPGLFNKDADKDDGHYQKMRKRQKRVKRIRRLLNYRYIYLILIVGAIFLLLVLVGALKLPDVMEGIESYEFAAVSRDFYETSSEYMDETLAVDSVSDDAAGNSIFDSLKSNFSDLTDGIWRKMLGTAPDDVLKDMAANSGFKMKFRTSKLTGRKIFTGGSINGDDYDIVPPSGIGRWVPGVRQYLKFKSQQNFYKSGFLDEAMEDMKARDVGPIVRYIDFLRILYASGGSLSGWILSKFTGSNNDEEDAVKATQGQYQATEAKDDVPDNTTMAQDAEAVTNAKTAESDAAKDPGQVAADVNDGGWLPQVLKAANKALAGSLIEDVLHYTGIVWAVFAPLCIIYDGSVVQSGPSISNQMNQVQDSFDQLAAEADQQKQGDVNGEDDGELANAVNGTNREIGDIEYSVPYQRTYGRPQATNFIPSVEAGSDGSYMYSLWNVVGIPANTSIPFFGATINGVTSEVCKLMTNIWTSVGLTIAQIAFLILTMGGSEVAGDAAGATSWQFIKDFTQTIITGIFGKKVITDELGNEITEGFMARAIRFAIGQATILTATVGLTFLAHLEVASRAGIAHDGLAQGSNLVDDADDGAQIQAGLTDRTQLFGRPLTGPEEAQIEGSSINEVDLENSQKSFTQRYFALSNYDSLLTHIGMDLGASDRFSVMSSITQIGSSVLRPFGSLASLLSTFTSPTAFAATSDGAAYNYGNVPFGWSQAEDNLINSSISYKPLENQWIIDHDSDDTSGNNVANDVMNKYSECFGYLYSTSGDGKLDPNDSNSDLSLDSTNGTVSALLVAAKIDRDANGNVINGGALCDPNNLSFNSPDALGNDPRLKGLNGVVSPKSHDMIMRVRLALAYDTTADQLISEGVINNQGEDDPSAN